MSVTQLKKKCCCVATGVDVTLTGLDNCGCFAGPTTSEEHSGLATLDGTYNLPETNDTGSLKTYEAIFSIAGEYREYGSATDCTGSYTGTTMEMRVTVDINEPARTINRVDVDIRGAGGTSPFRSVFDHDNGSPSTDNLGDSMANELSCSDPQPGFGDGSAVVVDA